MWMEERTGERINVNRITEAVETGADQVATGCPFCRVMLSDGLIAKQAEGSARNEVEVLDVAQLLLASVKAAPVPAATATVGTGTAPSTAQLERPVEVGAAAGASETGETGTASASPASETEPADGAATDVDARDATGGGTGGGTAPTDDAAVRPPTDEGSARDR